MNKNKIIYITSFVLSSILTNIMCIYATYNWIAHDNNPMNSAPAYVTLIYSIPFLLIIIILLVLGIIFYKKDKTTHL